MPRHTQPGYVRANAKRLRKQMTPEEKRLWQVIRAHRLGGIGFRRQMPIEGFIVDFAAPSRKVIIELDGSQHGETSISDADVRRDAKLKALGWTVLRFWLAEVHHDLDGVCRRILAVCREEHS
ncbi:endonuclease domain-containing protein [Roseibium polysiphoniae]|uniref:Endonuclease domain-containing protein n=1 Tax=Roseibium polysiphoniae TaxID=2571221 RepID=A0ABR9C5N9_9HYPH|nr:DUF559 domain-containing protein [Roseibium polysiphoniae]MBD8875214.1 endonuclease domain-containing protein [Roseibium polysiphoniae]